MLSLEIKCNWEAWTIHLSQCAYIDLILCHFHFDDLKPLSMPIDTSFQLTAEQAPASTAEHAIRHHVPYCKAVRALNWAALATCPNITFAISTIACFTSNPRPAHWEAVKQIFHYLAGMCNLWLLYGETLQALEGYADTNSSMAKDRHAITSYTFLTDGGAVSWFSKHQEIVSLSTTKSEYVTATYCMA